MSWFVMWLISVACVLLFFTGADRNTIDLYEEEMK